MIILLIRGDGLPEFFDMTPPKKFGYHIVCSCWWLELCADVREG